MTRPTPGLAAGASREEADVAIIGGGPAGAAAAIFLARLGCRVVLFERNRLGEPKLCGEFLSPEAMPVLEALGVASRLARHSPPSVTEVRITTPSGRSWCAPLPAAGLGVSRSVLDAELLDSAAAGGVEVRRASSVHRIRGGDGLDGEIEGVGPEGPFRAIARAVLLATGKASPLIPGGDGSPGWRAFQAHFKGSAVAPRVELHAFHDGYLGLIDVERGRSNLCMLVRRDPRLRPNRPDAFVQRAAVCNAGFAAWLSGARRVSAWSSTSRIDLRREEPAPPHGPLRIGDAAGLVAPLTGDGQAMALRSAALVAPILFDLLRSRLDPTQARLLYGRAWREEFHARLRDARILQRLLLSRTALQAALLVLPHAPRVGRAILQRTRGPVACAP